ncbi:MAG: energy-coupling factor ABC transporter ATP-binding protein [Lachnospiraceae bacterium]|jgi:cobalt/nickel transport system ATP-binding protein
MSEIILEAENLCFTYDGSRTPALKECSIQIRRGSKVAVLGANGSGKSTFFLCCNGIHKPSMGRLYYKGRPVDYSRKGLLDLRRKVGIVFQDPDNQLFSASVYQEISFGILNLGASKEQAKEATERIMEEMNISAFREKPVHALSGGQKKLVSIADVLVMEPEIVIMDEPASALDPRHTELVNRAVDQMSEKGITVIMATHDVDYAFAWADEAAVFHEGRVLRQGPPDEVFADQKLLAETHLVQPAVMRLFNRLCQKNILDSSLSMPRNVDELEKYL